MRPPLSRAKGRHATIAALAVIAGVVAADAVIISARGPSAAASASPAHRQTQAQVASRTADHTAPTPTRVEVAGLRKRVRADLMVTSRTPLTRPQVRRVRRSAGASGAVVVDTGQVKIGRGRTVALGVDASTFRAFTPAGTAGVDVLWQSVADGNVAVAHTVAKALDVPLGGTVRFRGGHGTPTTLRVGAYATTGLPGIGAVVPKAAGHRLHLVRNGAEILGLRHADAALTTAARLRDRFPHLRVTTVQRFVTVTRRAAWVAPAAGSITSGFGPRPYPFDPTKTDFHPGIDIAAPLGAPIWAAADGTVLYAGPAKGFGNEIILLHAGGVTTVYGHMSRLLVTRGVVHAGEAIALVGSEGESTGPHLHFEVHLHDQLVDPVQWLRRQGALR